MIVTIGLSILYAVGAGAVVLVAYVLLVPMDEGRCCDPEWWLRDRYPPRE